MRRMGDGSGHAPRYVLCRAVWWFVPDRDRSNIRGREAADRRRLSDLIATLTPMYQKSRMTVGFTRRRRPEPSVHSKVEAVIRWISFRQRWTPIVRRIRGRR